MKVDDILIFSKLKEGVWPNIDELEKSISELKTHKENNLNLHNYRLRSKKSELEQKKQIFNKKVYPIKEKKSVPNDIYIEHFSVNSPTSF